MTTQDRLTVEDVESERRFYQAASVGAPLHKTRQYLEQLAETMRCKSELEQLWFPICEYLQDHPEVVGAKLGESLSKKLLEFLKQQSNKELE